MITVTCSYCHFFIYIELRIIRFRKVFMSTLSENLFENGGHAQQYIFCIQFTKLTIIRLINSYNTQNECVGIDVQIGRLKSGHLFFALTLGTSCSPSRQISISRRKTGSYGQFQTPQFLFLSILINISNSIFRRFLFTP